MARQFNRSSAALLLVLCVGNVAHADSDAQKSSRVDATIDEMATSNAALPDTGVRTDISETELRKVLEKNGVNLDDLQKSAILARQKITPMLGLDNKSLGGKEHSVDGVNSELLVFVSFSMPKASLERAIRDARQTGAVLVLRGMKNNRMGDTLAGSKALTGGMGASWQMSSVEYKSLGITAVPTTVMRMGAKRITECEANSQTSCIAQPWYGVEGDVSIEYALEQMVKHVPEASHEAGLYLARLRQASIANGLPGQPNE